MVVLPFVCLILMMAVLNLGFIKVINTFGVTCFRVFMLQLVALLLIYVVLIIANLSIPLEMLPGLNPIEFHKEGASKSTRVVNVNLRP